MNSTKRVATVMGACLLLLCLASTSRAQMAVHTVSLSTDGSGDDTAYTPTTSGTLVAVRYVPHASTPLVGEADITITDNVTGLQLLAVTDIGSTARDFWPRAFTVSTTGVVALYAGSGLSVLDLVPIAHAIKVVVAQGGASKAGTLYLYVQGR